MVLEFDFLRVVLDCMVLVQNRKKLVRRILNLSARYGHLGFYYVPSHLRIMVLVHISTTRGLQP